MIDRARKLICRFSMWNRLSDESTLSCAYAEFAAGDWQNARSPGKRNFERQPDWPH